MTGLGHRDGFVGDHPGVPPIGANDGAFLAQLMLFDQVRPRRTSVIIETTK
jgi:hypothetical protein